MFELGGGVCWFFVVFFAGLVGGGCGRCIVWWG